MTKTALVMMMLVAVSAPAAHAQSQSTSEQPLPVSLDRIRKALEVQAPTTPLQPTQKPDSGTGVGAQSDVPTFATHTTSPIIRLSDLLDDGTAVPAYVRPPFDPTHYEFLEMVTPDAAKGCAQFNEKACLEAYSSRFASALAWDQFFSTGLDRAMRRLFKQP
jgi:hypothetical protein